MPDRRQEFTGRRSSDPKKPAEPVTPPAGETPPKQKVEQRAEVEPDRRHILHRKIGGKRAA